MFFFQTEICSSALTDVIHAVINGTDGCLFCFGHAGLGKFRNHSQWNVLISNFFMYFM